MLLAAVTMVLALALIVTRTRVKQVVVPSQVLVEILEHVQDLSFGVTPVVAVAIVKGQPLLSLGQTSAFVPILIRAIVQLGAHGVVATLKQEAVTKPVFALVIIPFIRFDSALVVAAMVAVLLHHLLVYQAGDRVLLRVMAAHRAMDVEIPKPAIPKCALLTLLISTLPNLCILWIKTTPTP